MAKKVKGYIKLEIAAGQAGKVEDIPAGQQHPRIDDAIVFLTADQRADQALQSIDDPFPIAKSQPNEQTKKDGYHQGVQQQNQQHTNSFHHEVGSKEVSTRMDQHASSQSQKRHQPAPTASHDEYTIKSLK